MREMHFTFNHINTPRFRNVATCAMLVAIFLLPERMLCQSIQYLTPRSITAGFGASGTLFNAVDTAAYADTLSSLLTIGHGYDIPTMLSCGFWVSGQDPGGNAKFAASTIYRNTDWATGPCSDTYGAAYDSLYNRVFKVTKSDIDYHIAHYQDNGYQMHLSISDWPGNGRTALHEQHNLAPYTDVNHNGIYDPQNGDYPNICGDEAVFIMLNDDRNPHSESEGEALKVQLNVLLFDVQDGIAASDSGAINSTLFMKLNLVNCSSTNYNKILVSLFSDYHIGCYENDRAGCDTVLNAFFGYNGSYPDSGCSGGNSSENKVAQGIVFLNQKLYTHAVFSAFTDTVIPNRPVPPADLLRNFQSGFWYDDISEPFTIGGNGFGGQIPTHYIYPGDPLNLNDWSDMTSGTMPGKRAGIGTVRLDTLLAGETKNIDVAFVSSFVLSADTNNEINVLKQRFASVQSYYPGFYHCGNEYTGLNDIMMNSNSLRIHPNPGQDFVQLDYSLLRKSEVTIQISDITGNILLVIHQGNLTDGEYSKTIDISAFSKGVYFCTLVLGAQTITQKLIKIE